MKRLFFLVFALLIFALPGNAQAAHSVTLSWSPSSSTGVTGYNVYRFVGACGPTVAFTKLASTTTALTYVDSAVTAGATYCYTVTAVSVGGESTNAGTWQAVIPIYTAPTNPAPPGTPSGTVQ